MFAGMMGSIRALDECEWKVCAGERVEATQRRGHAYLLVTFAKPVLVVVAVAAIFFGGCKITLIDVVPSLDRRFGRLTCAHQAALLWGILAKSQADNNLARPKPNRVWAKYSCRRMA